MPSNIRRSPNFRPVKRGAGAKAWDGFGESQPIAKGESAKSKSGILQFIKAKQFTPSSVYGVLSTTLGDATLAASGTLTVSGTLATTLSSATLAASGTLTASGTLATTLGSATLAANGTLTASGTLATTLGGSTLSASGALTVGGTITATMNDATLAANGAVTVTGTIAATLDDAVVAGSGSISSGGNTLPMWPQVHHGHYRWRRKQDGTQEWSYMDALDESNPPASPVSIPKLVPQPAPPKKVAYLPKPVLDVRPVILAAVQAEMAGERAALNARIAEIHAAEEEAAQLVIKKTQRDHLNSLSILLLLAS